MIIHDAFEYKGKRALYMRIDNEQIPKRISKAIVNGKHYNVIKQEITQSIIGARAITVLLDTIDEMFAGVSVDFE